MFDLVEYKTFLITSLASCKYSLLRAGLNLLWSLTAPGEAGSLPSVEDIDTTDWLTFDDSEVLSLLLNLTVKATNHLRTDSLALFIRLSNSVLHALDLLRGTWATAVNEIPLKIDIKKVSTIYISKRPKTRVSSFQKYSRTFKMLMPQRLPFYKCTANQFCLNWNKVKCSAVQLEFCGWFVNDDCKLQNNQ